MSQLRAILPYYRPYRAAMAWGVVLVVFAQGFGLALPWLVKLSIDGLSDPTLGPRRVLGYAGLIVLTA